MAHAAPDSKERKLQLAKFKETGCIVILDKQLLDNIYLCLIV